MARETYEVQEWVDDVTRVYAENMTKIEQGIKTAMDDRALKEIYDDGNINLGRSAGTTVGYHSATIGTGNAASGEECVAIGGSNLASNRRSLATGSATKATGTGTFTGGYGTEAKKPWSFAFGYGAKANGETAIAHGIYTIADYEAQAVFGKYNKSENRAFIIGGGTSETDRKNLMSIDWNGNTEYAGTVKTEGLKMKDTVTGQEYIITIADGNLSIVEV